MLSLDRNIYTQSNHAVFNQLAVDTTCKLCDSDSETRQFFLAECQLLQQAHYSFYRRIQQIHILVVDSFDTTSLSIVIQLILDPSVLMKNKTDINTIELYSRELILSIHRIYALSSYLVKKDNRL